MQTVYLNGGISQFGERWEANCTNIRDIFKLIDCQTPGFHQYLLEAAEAGVGFEVQRGKEFLSEPEELLLDLRDEDIIITEVPAGSKSGAGKILAAIAIITAVAMTGGFGGGGFFGQGGRQVFMDTGAGLKSVGFTGGGLNTAGLVATSIAANLALTGITQLLSPGPEVDSAGENEDGYLFNGPVSRAPEGIVVPVVYGELIVGGQPIGSAFKTGSPFSDTSRVASDNPFIDPDTGDVVTPDANTPSPTPGDTATSQPGGGGEVAPSDDQGIPVEDAPTSYPDPRDEDNNNADEGREQAPSHQPNIHVEVA